MTQNLQQDGADSAPPPTDTSSSAAANVLAALWRTFANPVLLLMLAIAAFLLVLAGLLTPQMPHPIYADPAAATRWLLNASIDFGSLGELWSTLGLFNLLHSMLLRILLVLIALMLAVQLADQVGLALILRALPARLSVPSPNHAMPIGVPNGGPIYRERSASTLSPEALAEETMDHLKERYVNTQKLSVAVGMGDEENDSDELDDVAFEGDRSEAVESARPDAVDQEVRILSLRALPFAYLRPLLPLGLLVGLLALWINVTFGWEVISPSLAPTESFQYPPRNLDIRYPTAVVDSAGFAIPMLQMTLDDRQKILGIGKIDRVGENRVITRPSAPSLLVRTESEDVSLTLPGDNTRTEKQSIGLSFPTPGSEASLILPDRAVGIRIIRRPVSSGPEEIQDDEDYYVEIYEASSASPTDRITLDEMKRQRVDVADGDVTLEFMPTVGVVVAVRSEPGSWLYWVAGLFFLAGLVGFVRTPAYVLAQIGQWSPTKAFVIVQSNVRRELRSLKERLSQTEIEQTESTLEP